MKKNTFLFFVIFIWRDDDELERLVWKLNNDSVDEVFKSIREVVEFVSETEDYTILNVKRVKMFIEVLNRM